MSRSTAPRALLLDIEGTTTPIRFVYDVLFPFAAERLAPFVAENGGRDDVAAAVGLLREDHAADAARGDAGLPAFGDGAAYARYLMAEDRKATGLKALQGLIWEEGYRSGALVGELFPDVHAALERWQARGAALRIFSSGSVLAQKLLFGHTAHGDLTPRFEGFHDTRTGPKREVGSYRAIAEAFAVEPSEILFLSDVTAELDAAHEAGLQTGLLARPGNPPAEAAGHTVYESFDAIL